MKTTGYTVLGWVVWKVGSRKAKQEIRENRVKIGAAAGVVAAVAVAGGLLARSRGQADDE